MTMTCKINKLEKPGGLLGIFDALFGRSGAFYGYFRADIVTSEWSTRISHHLLLDFKRYHKFPKHQYENKKHSIKYYGSVQAVYQIKKTSREIQQLD